LSRTSFSATGSSSRSPSDKASPSSRLRPIATACSNSRRFSPRSRWMPSRMRWCIVS
jgi:hypothetical protein